MSTTRHRWSDKGGILVCERCGIRKIFQVVASRARTAETRTRAAYSSDGQPPWSAVMPACPGKKREG